MSTTSITPERMVIAIDPHKASWTAAAVDASSQPSRLSVVRAMSGGAIDVRRSEGSFHGR